MHGRKSIDKADTRREHKTTQVSENNATQLSFELRLRLKFCAFFESPQSLSSFRLYIVQSLRTMPEDKIENDSVLSYKKVRTLTRMSFVVYRTISI